MYLMTSRRDQQQDQLPLLHILGFLHDLYPIAGYPLSPSKGGKNRETPKSDDAKHNIVRIK